MSTLSTERPSGSGSPSASLGACPHSCSFRLAAERRSRCSGSSSAPARAGSGTSGAHSAFSVGVHRTGRPPRAGAPSAALRALDQPLTSICGAAADSGGRSTHSAPPPSSNSMAAAVAGTPQTRTHARSASAFDTYSREPHCPTVPRLETSAPMLTYSRYGPTGDSSYSSATTPPMLQPKRERARTPSGSAPTGGDRTTAGRNQSRPRNSQG
mmetsp:Transcript_47138/g.151952  ORF Transcript_47138/g.151952 Transcript_47138/m.151952 type:complete len:212 (-) Transcript_47138:143-778(-)